MRVLPSALFLTHVLCTCTHTDQEKATAIVMLPVRARHLLFAPIFPPLFPPRERERGIRSALTESERAAQNGTFSGIQRGGGETAKKPWK